MWYYNFRLLSETAIPYTIVRSSFVAFSYPYHGGIKFIRAALFYGQVPPRYTDLNLSMRLWHSVQTINIGA